MNEAAAEACSEGRELPEEGALGGGEAGGFDGSLGGFDTGGLEGALGGFDAGGFAGVLGGFETGGFEPCGSEGATVWVVAFDATNVAEQPMSPVRIGAAVIPKRHVEPRRAQGLKLTASDVPFLSVQGNKLLDSFSMIESRTASC